MIRINKSTTLPSTWVNKCKEATEKLVELAGKRSLDGTDFDSGIYGDRVIKEKIRKDQHDKCAYCESYLPAITYGDVEHFRPKAYYQQEKEGKRSKTGYYWLTYDWENLLYSCEVCNRSYKKNLFPLVDVTKRADTPEKDMTKEQPVLINPMKENPEEFIGFHRHVTFGKGERGKQTIEILGLNRPELKSTREKRYKILEYMMTIVRLAGQGAMVDSEDIQKSTLEQINILCLPESEYSLMNKCAKSDLM